MRHLAGFRMRRPRRRSGDVAAASTVTVPGEPTGSLPLPPIFVGGTGRSGTTITGRLLGAHPAYHMIGTEVRFIAARGGLCDLVDGRTTYPAFEKRLLDEWYLRGPRKGLHVIMDRAAVEAALPALRDGFKANPIVAARTFAHDLLDPVAAAAGGSGWIEMTPPNVRSPATLLRLFPSMRLVHSVRDGRDVACSVATTQQWGPSDIDEALDWWATRLERAFRACEALPPDRVHVVRMEDLTVHDRARAYGRLLAFLGLQDDPAMREFFETVMTPEKAHLGRWRRDVAPERQPAFEAHYRRLAADLVKRGRPYAPDESAGAAVAES